MVLPPDRKWEFSACASECKTCKEQDNVIDVLPDPLSVASVPPVGQDRLFVKKRRFKLYLPVQNFGKQQKLVQKDSENRQLADNILNFFKKNESHFVFNYGQFF